MSDHNWVLENLESYHAGGLNSAERERLEGHLAKCGACSKALQEIRGMDDRLEGLFADSRPEPGLEDRMIRSLRVGGSKSKSRLPVIGWIGLSAAAAVLLGILGASLDYLVREGGRISLANDLKQLGLPIHVFHDSQDDRLSKVITTIDSSLSMETSDREEMTHRYGQPTREANRSGGIAGKEAEQDVDQMASRLGNETIAKVDSGKSVAFSADGKELNDTRQIMAGYDDSGAPDGSMGVEAHVYGQKDFDRKEVTAGGGELRDPEAVKDKRNGEGWSYRQHKSGGVNGKPADANMAGIPLMGGGGGGFSGGLGLGGLGGGGGAGNNLSLQPGIVSSFPPVPNPQLGPVLKAGAPTALGRRPEAPAAEAPVPTAGFGMGVPAAGPHSLTGKDGDAKDATKQLQELALSGAISEKALQEGRREVHTYRNEALPTASNEYFRPGEQAKADAEKLLKEIAQYKPSRGLVPGKKQVADASGVVVGLGNQAGFTAGLDIPPKGKGDQKPGNPDTAPAGPRKVVIRSGTIVFDVDSFDSAVATVTLLVNKIQGGFVATVNSEKLENGKVKGEVVVRVPPESLDGLVLDLRKELGKSGELKGQKIGSQDISKPYTDLESRLKAARAMEERLLQIIKSGKGEIKDLVAAEKELGGWRTKIEEFEGELRYYASQVALSTLTVNLAEKEIRAPFAVIETERIQMGVEVEDVIKAQQQVLKAVEEAKGRVTKSDLKQQAADQLNAVISFEVAPDKAGPLRDRVEQLGKRTRLEIDRLQETEGGTGKPGEIKTRRKDTLFILSLFNTANVDARETTHLNLACVDAEDVYKKILARVETAAGRVVSSNLNRQGNDQTSGMIQFQVKSADAGAVLLNVKGLGEVMSLQVVENPDAQNVTRSKQAFHVQLFSLAGLEPKETTCIQLATRDVPAGYRAIQEALTKAKARIRSAQLNEQNKQNITAQLDFDIRRADEAAVSAAMTAAGDIFSRNVTRAADAANVVDSKVRWQLTLINQDQIAPRETTTLGIEVSNVDKTAADLLQLATASKGRVVGSDVARERTGRTTAKLIFTVPLSAAPALVEKFRAAGTVRVQRHSENPQVPESELAVARLDVTLSNAPLVPSDEGFGPELRKGLSTSVKVLSLSLSWLLFGLLVVLPWVLVIYAIFRLVMRMRRKTATAPTV